METIPAFEFSPSEFYGLTGGLSPSETGTALVLVGLLWLAQETDCALADDGNLPSALELTQKQWAARKKRLMRTSLFVPDGDGWIYSPWLREKLTTARRRRAAFRQGGKNSAAQRAKVPQAPSGKGEVASGTLKHLEAPEIGAEEQERSPQTPLKNKPQSQSQSQKPPQPPTRAEASAEADGSLVAFPKTREALGRYPSEPTQAQMLRIMAAAAKRGDAVAAAIIDATAVRVRGDPKIYAPNGWLVRELETRKEAPVAKRAIASEMRIGSHNEAALLAAQRPKAEAWVREHGEPETDEQRVRMYNETGGLAACGVDWKWYSAARQEATQ